MQEQIKMSGLEITPSSQLQWNPSDQWISVLGGRRKEQACVTIVSSDGDDAHPCENDSAGQIIVIIIGGEIMQIGQSGEYTNSVIVSDPSTKEWRNGPTLNDKRSGLVAVVCRDKVYAIGGCGGDNNFNNTVLDTIESIHVSSLLETSMTRRNNNQWTRLQCRLSSPRDACAAVVVHNRYVVILGGNTGIGQASNYLSSGDIMDTAPPHNNNDNNGEPTIVAGPNMNLARDAFGAAVMDNRIFVVGGGVLPSTSVESLLFQQQPQDMDHTNSMSWTFPYSSWRMEPHLTLSTFRSFHVVAKVGSCLVVAGGSINDGTAVEVLDIRQGLVWSLPNLIIPRQYGYSMVTLSDCLLVLGGNPTEDAVESLALTVYQKHERCYKFLKFLIEIEFLG